MLYIIFLYKYFPLSPQLNNYGPENNFSWLYNTIIASFTSYYLLTL